MNAVRGDGQKSLTSASRLGAATLRVALLAHAALAVLLLWKTPRGFGFASVATWTRLVLPALVLAAALAGTVSPRARARAGVGLAFCGLWLGVALPAATVFHFSAAPLLWALLPASAALGLLAWRAEPGVPTRALTLAAGFIVGLLSMLGQRAPPPSTHPLVTATAVTGGDRDTEVVDVTCGRLHVRVAPRLTFFSCASDDFWALFAGRECPQPTPGALQVDQRDGATVIDCASTLDAPVFSHLNRFSTLLFDRAGLRLQLGTAPPLAFATGGSAPPLRFLWLDATGLVHLDEAAHDEKGPFTSLATAPLEGGVLSLIVWDDVGPACRVSFDTFAAQASTAPSPTAGWGVAQNSLELFDDAARHQAAILAGLAATSVGEGWDSVGHAAGTYRTVLRFEPLGSR